MTVIDERLATHLSALVGYPVVDAAGNPVVPEMLDFVLRHFNDDVVLENFLAGAHSGEVWWGNGAEQFRREAENARHFLNHANPRIREWANSEIASCLQMADIEDREHEERLLPT